MTEEVTDIQEMKADIKEIKVAIVGDVDNADKIGLKGHVALVKSSLNRVWWVLLIVIGLLGWVMRT